jgi:enamine deaminase RidA (YjgF/YER057c/UK114 family)
MKIFQTETSNKAEYYVSLKPGSNILFVSQLDDILEKYEKLIESLNITDNELVYVKVFLSDFLNQKDGLRQHPLFREKFNNTGLSIVEQPPLDGAKINLLLCFVKGIEMNKSLKDNVFYLETEKHTHIFQSVGFERIFDSDIEKNTEKAFEIHKDALSKKEMSLSENCLRTWLYVKDIDKNYKAVVNGRNNFFGNNGLNRNIHFIASTGIGGTGGISQAEMFADFYSVKGLKKEQIKYLKALDYLNPTYEYGVSFERGTSITCSDVKHIFISGTASIDKSGKCIHAGDIVGQTERIFLNIKNLLLDADADLNDLAYLIVYLRDIADYEAVNKYLATHFGQIPTIIVAAKICRPEWLIEIECFAVKKN